MWDVEGNRYLDCLVSNGACILGHGNPAVVAAVRAQLETGLTVGFESELSVDVAEMLHLMIPSAEIVKFSNTGTEAVAHAIQIARGHKGRQKIVKMEGCYNGWLDEMQVSVHPDTTKRLAGSSDPIPESEGLVSDLSSRVAIAPYNDASSLERLLKGDRGAFAAVIVEPVMFNSGCVLPLPGYLKELREIADKHDVLLIFDEVITGFRMAPGGAQEFYGVKPDISVFAKAIANGFPLSAVVGLKEIMESTTPGRGRVSFAGTYNGTQPSLAASKATIEAIRDGGVQERLHRGSKMLVRRFNELAAANNVPAQMIGIGGQFQPYFTDSDVKDYRTAASSDQKSYAIFAKSIFDSGLLVHQSYLFHHGVSDAHGKDEYDEIIRAFEKGLHDVARGTP
jgi:glutamate-1-semialdehyde 2,1-aminomutase